MTTTCLHCGNSMQSQRSTRKYCSDNCKQLAFYKRSGSALSGLNSSTAVANSTKQETYKDLPTELPIQQLDSPPAIATSDSLITPAPAPEETPYQWVHSKMVDSIAEYTDSGEELFMFQYPAKYWSVYVLPTVKWVSVRLRCLIESLITLSNMPFIDNDSMVAVKEAFTALVNSSHFKRLPDNYPYLSLVKELEQKITLIAKQHKHTESIQFRLTLNRKAKLIAIRYILADFVPAMKFSEMNFNE